MGEVLNFETFFEESRAGRGAKPRVLLPPRFLPLDIREDLEYNIEVGCNHSLQSIY